MGDTRLARGGLGLGVWSWEEEKELIHRAIIQFEGSLRKCFTASLTMLALANWVLANAVDTCILFWKRGGGES